MVELTLIDVDWHDVVHQSMVTLHNQKQMRSDDWMITLENDWINTSRQ